jgi:hypothetical protein
MLQLRSKYTEATQQRMHPFISLSYLVSFCSHLNMATFATFEAFLSVAVLLIAAALYLLLFDF